MAAQAVLLHCAFACFAAAASASTAGLTMAPPTNLRTEYLAEPMGVDRQDPRFSWELPASSPPTRAAARDFQAVFRITVALAGGGPLLWDSGNVSSSATQAHYQGKNFSSDTLYAWNLTITAGNGATSGASASFHTGLFAANDWTASWITSSNGMMRKPFVVAGPLVRAVAFATAEGYHELYLNGGKVSDRVLDVIRSDYGKRVFYTTYATLAYPTTRRGTTFSPPNGGGIRSVTPTLADGACCRAVRLTPNPV